MSLLAAFKPKVLADIERHRAQFWATAVDVKTHGVWNTYRRDQLSAIAKSHAKKGEADSARGEMSILGRQVETLFDVALCRVEGSDPRLFGRLRFLVGEDPPFATLYLRGDGGIRTGAAPAALFGGVEDHTSVAWAVEAMVELFIEKYAVVTMPADGVHPPQDG